MRKLDIIVTHYDEDWTEGRKFFDMLALQRGVDFDEIRVILVHDGSERFPKEFFFFYPYRVEQLTKEHGGVSAARNQGMMAADAPWICFCDFDDTMASVYSLRHVLTLLPTDDYDILWGDFYSEDVMKNGELRLNRRTENSVFIHSKFFRRAFLERNGLTFPEDLEFNEDSAFVTIALAVCDYRRVGRIKTETPLYVWTFRPGSLTATEGNRWKAYIGLYQRNRKVCEAFRAHVSRDRYLTMICRACYDAYHMLNLREIPDELRPILGDFRGFWKEHRGEFIQCASKDRMAAWEASRREHEQGDREEEQRWGTGGDLAFNQAVSFRAWINGIEKGGD